MNLDPEEQSHFVTF